MRAAIITYHRAYNYGSALQAYALNAFLNHKGIVAETIDYVTDRQANLYTIFEKNRGLVSIARNIHSFVNYRKLVCHKRRFDSFIQEHVILTGAQFKSPEELYVLNEQYDIFICGSDQIWNPQTADFDASYLLSFVSDKSKCIAFSPSIGISEIDEKSTDLFKTNLQHFRCLSVRESTGAKLLEGLLGRRVYNTIDPVFLLTESEWEQISDDSFKRPYVLGYFIGDVAGMREFADRVRSNTGLPVVVVYKSLRDLKYRHINAYDSGPEQFVGLIKNAKIVITNSFHATAFSLIFKKDFWVFTDVDNPKSSRSRIDSLLSKFGMTERIINKCTMNEVDGLASLQYGDKYRQTLSELRNESINYLLEALR